MRPPNKRRVFKLKFFEFACMFVLEVCRESTCSQLKFLSSHRFSAIGDIVNVLKSSSSFDDWRHQKE